MPPTRFRIRTIMIVVAELAVLMAIVRALTGLFFDDTIVLFAAAVVFLAVETVGSLLLAMQSFFSGN
jgi:hypothetical protein